MAESLAQRRTQKLPFVAFFNILVWNSGTIFSVDAVQARVSTRGRPKMDTRKYSKHRQWCYIGHVTRLELINLTYWASTQCLFLHANIVAYFSHYKV